MRKRITVIALAIACVTGITVASPWRPISPVGSVSANHTRMPLPQTTSTPVILIGPNNYYMMPKRGSWK